MRTTEVLQSFQGESLQAIHSLRFRLLMRAVEVTVAGRRLILIDLTRGWLDGKRIRAPVKALGRLSGKPPSVRRM